MKSSRRARVGLTRALRLLRFTRGVARWGIPRRSLLFGPLSLGDDLLCTTVLREARRRGTPFTMMTARPELFAGNPDPARVIPIDDDYVAGLRHLGASVIQPYYLGTDPIDPQRDRLPARPILAEMCALAGLHGDVTLRPYLHLTAAELAVERHLPRQIVLHSSGLGAAIPYDTKEWGVDRFAAVAASLSAHAGVVQLGSLRDPPLPGALDLRGRTTLREAAAILSVADLFIGLEGFLVHLARAVDCPAVVIMGGRAPATIFGYSANTNLAAFPACGPCALRTGCPHALQCMDEISPGVVSAAALRWLAQPPRRPLAVDTATLR